MFLLKKTNNQLPLQHINNIARRYNDIWENLDKIAEYGASTKEWNTNICYVPICKGIELLAGKYKENKLVSAARRKKQHIFGRYIGIVIGQVAE